MSHFIYKVKKSSGEIFKGEKDSKDRYELYKILKESGDEVIDVREGEAGFSIFKNLGSFLTFAQRVKMQEKINFARNLGSMISAGLSMARALSVMERQTKNKTMQKVISSLLNDVNQGKPLSEAMRSFKKVF